MSKVKVTIWNENIHERQEGPTAEIIRSHYPDGIHNALREELAADDLEIRAVSLDMPEQGLPQALARGRGSTWPRRRTPQPLPGRRRTRMD